jgi:regulator of sigma E protease
MSALHYLFFFLLAIAVLIVVHEFGHFSAARLCGIKVLRFSLGFGPKVLSRQANAESTEWVLAAIPLGGYVKMLDEREGPVDASELHAAFNTQPVWKRAIVVSAGPVSNLILAAVIYFVLACVGSRDLPSVLGEIPANSPAAAAGLLPGDQIVRFAETSVRGWGELRWQIIQHALGNQIVRVDVLRHGQTIRDLSLKMDGLSIEEKGPDPSRQLGLNPKLLAQRPVIGDVLPDWPAAQAGFKKGDLVRRVDSLRVDTWADFVATIVKAPGRTLHVSIDRRGVEIDLVVTPKAIPPQIQKEASPPSDRLSGRQMEQNIVKPSATGRIGAGALFDEEAFARQTILIRYGILDGVGHALRQTAGMAVFDLRAFWHIVTGSLSWKNVSGPISIADVAGQSARAGLEAYLSMIAALSVSLGVLNLLPIPILDGGHLLYYVSECIRGKAVSERMEELGQKIGLAILVLLMSLAFFNDLNRVFFG